MSKRSRAGFYKKINTELSKNLSLLSQDFINEEGNDAISKYIITTTPLSQFDNTIEDSFDKDLPEDNSYFANDVRDLCNEQIINKKDDFTTESSFTSDFKNWALKHRICHSAINDLYNY